MSVNVRSNSKTGSLPKKMLKFCPKSKVFSECIRCPEFIWCFWKSFCSYNYFMLKYSVLNFNELCLDFQSILVILSIFRAEISERNRRNLKERLKTKRKLRSKDFFQALLLLKDVYKLLLINSIEVFLEITPTFNQFRHSSTWNTITYFQNNFDQDKNLNITFLFQPLFELLIIRLFEARIRSVVCLRMHVKHKQLRAQRSNKNWNLIRM